MKEKIILNKIPTGFEEFQNYMNESDDLQKALDTIGFTIYPVDAKGKRKYDDVKNQKEIKNKPTYFRWNWKEEESKEWSRFRKEFDSLYKKYNADDTATKLKLEQLISDCIAYNREHKLIQRIAESSYSINDHYIA